MVSVTESQFGSLSGRVPAAYLSGMSDAAEAGHRLASEAIEWLRSKRSESRTDSTTQEEISRRARVQRRSAAPTSDSRNSCLCLFTGLYTTSTIFFSVARGGPPHRQVQVERKGLSQGMHGIDCYVCLPALNSAQMRPISHTSHGRIDRATNRSEPVSWRCADPTGND